MKDYKNLTTKELLEEYRDMVSVQLKLLFHIKLDLDFPNPIKTTCEAIDEITKEILKRTGEYHE